MCLVAYKERDVLQLGSMSEIKWDHVTQEIQKEGIYVFGGVKGDQPDIRVKDNSLYMLSIGDKRHSWSTLQTNGRPPEARYQHTMHFLRFSNSILVIGGRKLGEKLSTDPSSEFIRETHVLNVHTLDWSSLAMPGLPSMYNFASCQTEDGDLYIFGGTEAPLAQSKKLLRIREANQAVCADTRHSNNYP